MSGSGREPRRLRAEQARSLRDLARHVALRFRELSKIARGQKRPSPELAARLGEVLGAGGGLRHSRLPWRRARWSLTLTQSSWPAVPKPSTSAVAPLTCLTSPWTACAGTTRALTRSVPDDTAVRQPGGPRRALSTTVRGCGLVRSRRGGHPEAVDLSEAGLSARRLRPPGHWGAGARGRPPVRRGWRMAGPARHDAAQPRAACGQVRPSGRSHQPRQRGVAWLNCCLLLGLCPAMADRYPQ